ncbi:MAG: hypothetical protein JSR82_16455 [Verrucomicrobia bacterium]|nr:hypothetical protein [Verrucomicrobiota bacterium]
MKTSFRLALVLGAAFAFAATLPAQSVVTVGALGTPSNGENFWTNGPVGNLNTSATLNFGFGGTYGPSGDQRPGLQMTAYSGQLAAVEFNNFTTGIGTLNQFLGGNYTWSAQAGDQVSFKLSLVGLSGGSPVFRGSLVYVPSLQTGGNTGVDTWYTESFTQSSGLFFSTFPGAGGQTNLQTLASWLSSPLLTSGLDTPTLAVFSVQLGVGSSGPHSTFQATVNQLVLNISGASTFGAGTTPYTVNFVPEPGTILAGVFGVGALAGLVVRRVRARR